MHRQLLILLGSSAFLGAGIALWASLGDASVMSATAGAYSALEARGLGDNVPLRSELYSVILRLQWPWAVVQWMGLGVLGLAAAGFAVVWRHGR